MAGQNPPRAASTGVPEDGDWLDRQYARSLAHLRSLDPALLSPVTRELLAAAETRHPVTYPPLRLVPVLTEDT